MSEQVPSNELVAQLRSHMFLINGEDDTRALLDDAADEIERLLVIEKLYAEQCAAAYARGGVIDSSPHEPSARPFTGMDRAAMRAKIASDPDDEGEIGVGGTAPPPATEHPPQLMAVVDRWQDNANSWREMTPHTEREDAALVDLILREIRATVSSASPPSATHYLDGLTIDQWRAHAKAGWAMYAAAKEEATPPPEADVWTWEYEIGAWAVVRKSDGFKLFHFLGNYDAQLLCEKLNSIPAVTKGCEHE